MQTDPQSAYRAELRSVFLSLADKLSRGEGMEPFLLFITDEQGGVYKIFSNQSGPEAFVEIARAIHRHGQTNKPIKNTVIQ